MSSYETIEQKKTSRYDIEELRSKILLPYSDKEIELCDNANKVTKLLAQLGTHLADSNPKLKSIWYNSKNPDDKGNKKEFGYWASDQAAGRLLILARRLGMKSICDLGCGAAFVMKAIKAFADDIYVYGYDNEEELIKITNSRHMEPYLLKDITLIEKTDILGYNRDTFKRDDKSLLYFWEPIKDLELCKKFINNLCDIMLPGQIVIFSVAGPSLGCMRKNIDKMEWVTEFYFGMYIFRKIK